MFRIESSHQRCTTHYILYIGNALPSWYLGYIHVLLMYTQSSHSHKVFAYTVYFISSLNQNHPPTHSHLQVQNKRWRRNTMIIPEQFLFITKTTRFTIFQHYPPWQIFCLRYSKVGKNFITINYIKYIRFIIIYIYFYMQVEHLNSPGTISTAGQTALL